MCPENRVTYVSGRTTHYPTPKNSHALSIVKTGGDRTRHTSQRPDSHTGSRDTRQLGSAVRHGPAGIPAAGAGACGWRPVAGQRSAALDRILRTAARADGGNEA